jgi:hypothetical protein
MMPRKGYFVAAATAASVAALVVGCTASASVGGSGGLAPPSGCSSDSSVQCSEGVGWSCSAGDNPEAETSGLSCSDPTPDGPNDDFCCFDWTYGTSSCTPDDSLTSDCQPGSYGYQCSQGDNPTTLDGSLNCSSPTPDGSNDDFCCD